MSRLTKKSITGWIFCFEAGGSVRCGICSHYHERYGELVRIFEKRYSSKPDLEEVRIDDGVQLTKFCPLIATINDGLVEPLGRVSVPDHLSAFPLFRTGMRMPAGSPERYQAWHTWDGTESRRLDRLPKSMRQLPIRGIANIAYIIDKLEQGYREEDDY